MEQSELKPRNYSFLNRKEETLDTVELDNGTEYVIPATAGTTYWAILKFFYERHDEYIDSQTAINGIREIMDDRDPDKWEKYCNKSQIRTFKEGKIIVKDASPWNIRLENNIKTLTRTGGSNQYGLRLIERGHILQWNPDALSNGGFILKTDSNEPIKKGKRRKKQ